MLLAHISLGRSHLPALEQKKNAFWKVLYEILIPAGWTLPLKTKNVGEDTGSEPQEIHQKVQNCFSLLWTGFMFETVPDLAKCNTGNRIQQCCAVISHQNKFMTTSREAVVPSVQATKTNVSFMHCAAPMHFLVPAVRPEQC